MSLREDVRECPATYGLAAAWVAVYLAMLAVQGGFGTGGGFMEFGAVAPSITELFGDLTWRDFARGEYWRVLTASFIHFGAAHLVMNLIGMIQLGRLMEPWYGGRQFLAICLGLGAAGNLLGVLMRHGVALGRAWLQSHGLARVLPAALAGGAPAAAQEIHAGGGSTVLLGLIGLGMVVAWRSRTRVGAFLRDQMVAVLVITAILGVAWMTRIDNYGHAGGALAGAALGFLHPRLVRTPPRGRRLASWASALVVIGCVAAQAHVARRELAQARRGAALREATEGLRRIDGALIPALAALHHASERVAFDRALASLDEAARRGDPARALGSDASSALDVLAQVGAVSERPAVERLKDALTLRGTLDALDAIAPALGPALADDTYREAVAIGRDLLAGPIESRSLYALRVDLDVLARRATRTRDEWRARKDSLEAAAPAH
ncbi:MAG TPA: rhomboid family intramembrane serine protease [Isosphaeraceae bacterium]